MLMKVTKFSKQKCYFLTLFCPADNPVYVKGTRVVPGNRN